MSGDKQSVRRALGGPAFPAVPGFRRLPAYLASGPHITWPLSSASSSEDLVTTTGSPRESKTIPTPRPRSGPLTEPHLQSPLLRRVTYAQGTWRFRSGRLWGRGSASHTWRPVTRSCESVSAVLLSEAWHLCPLPWHGLLCGSLLSVPRSFFSLSSPGASLPPLLPPLGPSPSLLAGGCVRKPLLCGQTLGPLQGPLAAWPPTADTPPQTLCPRPAGPFRTFQNQERSVPHLCVSSRNAAPQAANILPGAAFLEKPSSASRPHLHPNASFLGDTAPL